MADGPMIWSMTVTPLRRYSLCPAIMGIPLLLAVLPAMACDVPVFRYALERWRPAIYRVLVYHRGSLAAEQQELFKTLEALSLDRNGLANFSVERVNLDAKPDSDTLTIFKAQDKPVLPWVVVCYPENDPSIPHAWAGPLTAANIQLLADSPARRLIAGKIIGGSCAIWMLLTCGDARLDDAAAEKLERELRRMESELGLPDDPETKADEKPLKVQFPMVRVWRDDPAEAMLVGNLLRRDPDVAKQRQPIAFPVFGRGRALCALVGEEMITSRSIESAARFLTGPCSCEVKEQNPGMDLLFSVDWDSAAMAAAPMEPPLPTLGPSAPLPRKSAATDSRPPAPAHSLYGNLLITLLALAIVVVAVAIALAFRRRAEI